MIKLKRLKEVLHYNPKTGIFKWSVNKGPRASIGSIAGVLDGDYTKICIDGERYYAHRLAWFYMTGIFPKKEIDHKKGYSNRFNNLREADHYQNTQNSKHQSNNTSGVKGVYFDKRSRRWYSQIRANGERINLGSFSSLSKAAKIRRKATHKYHGDFARMI